MDILKRIETVQGLAEPLASGQANTLAADIGAALEADVYASSLAIKDSTVWFLAKKNDQKMIGQICSDCKKCENLVGQTIKISLGGERIAGENGTDQSSKRCCAARESELHCPGADWLR